VNPVTRVLLNRLRHRHLGQFVGYWDALEALVIRIYKQAAASQADQSEYLRLQSWLLKNYPRWQQALAPHWQKVRVNRRLVEADPFIILLAPERVSAFVENWAAMQTLPAAREALNNFLLEQP